VTAAGLVHWPTVNDQPLFLVCPVNPALAVDAVLADAPRVFWLVDEAAGTATAQDRSGNKSLGSYKAAAVLGRPGGLPSNPGTSLSTSGKVESFSGYVRGGGGSGTAAFSGFIDNVPVYGTALSAQRVAAHWAAR
jgi:hypothetical protein